MTFTATPRLAVSVVIPARDEVGSIERCIERVAAQTLGAKQIELIVADGGSSDGTGSAARSAACRAGFGRFVVADNTDRTRSSGLNLGLRLATTDVVARVDARALIGPAYLATCLRLLDETGAVCVGGAQIAVARSDGSRDRAVARALRNRLAMGFSRYRRRREAGPTDTVWLGVYRRRAVDSVGGWPVELDINEDFELNRRLRSAGGMIWFDPTLATEYLPRQQIVALAKQYWTFGRSKGTWWRIGQPMEFRHAVLMGLPVLSVVAAIVCRGKLGAKPTAGLAGGALMLLDHVGVDEPASVRLRAMAAFLNVLMTAMWWSGAVAGLVRPATGRSRSR